MSDPRDRFPRVQGKCPFCRSESLFLGEGGYVTCSVLSCRVPDAATILLETLDYPPRHESLAPVDWQSNRWGSPGQNVHDSRYVRDRHDDSEDAAEVGRG